MPRLVSLSLVAALGAAPLAAQTPSDSVRSVSACAGSLVPYAERDGLMAPEWSLDLAAASGGHLTYIGAEHSRDPSHAQFARIAEAWDRTRPTVAFYEGPARPTATTADETIRQYGESGYVRYLALRDSARIERLEPAPQAEFVALRALFPLDQIQLFYVLREASRLREREGKTGPEIEAAIAQLLDHAAALFGEPWTLRDLDAAYRSYWSEPAEWWQAPTRWFTPGDDPRETGGIFTNAVNRASSEFRNRHMYTVLAEAARRGERVFAVVGRDHVPAQAPALRCALEAAPR